MAIETPKYTVIKNQGKFELRKYSAFLTSNVEVSAENHASAGSSGFSYLAGYIFGGNKASQKIAMTAPVMTSQTKKGNFLISFVIPSKYSMKDLTAPNQNSVTFIEMDEMNIASVTFSGYTSEEKINSKTDALQNWMADQNLQQIGYPIIARYDPPWKPGFLRKNEILIAYKA